MDSTLLARRDLEFLLYEWLEAEQMVAHPRFAEHSRETFGAVLEVAEALAERKFRTHNRKADLNEPVFDGQTVTLIPEVAEALAALSETGSMSATLMRSSVASSYPISFTAPASRGSRRPISPRPGTRC